MILRPFNEYCIILPLSCARLCFPGIGSELAASVPETSEQTKRGSRLQERAPFLSEALGPSREADSQGASAPQPAWPPCSTQNPLPEKATAAVASGPEHSFSGRLRHCSTGEEKHIVTSNRPSTLTQIFFFGGGEAFSSQTYKALTQFSAECSFPLHPSLSSPPALRSLQRNWTLHTWVKPREKKMHYTMESCCEIYIYIKRMMPDKAKHSYGK